MTNDNAGPHAITVAFHAQDAETELRRLLARADFVDLERLVAILDRWPRPARLADAWSVARTSSDPAARAHLEEVMVSAFLRDATGELAWNAKRLVGRTATPDLHAAITRAGRRLGTRPVPAAGTITGRLAALTTAFVDRTLAKLPPEEQQRLVAQGIARTTGAVPSAPRVVQAAALPALHAAIGTAALVRVAEAIASQMTAAILGREIARATMRAIVSRAPIVTAALGPAAWAVSAATLVWEVQRPADRKVIPALVCLGLIAMREASVR